MLTNKSHLKISASVLQNVQHLMNIESVMENKYDETAEIEFCGENKNETRKVQFMDLITPECMPNLQSATFFMISTNHLLRPFRDLNLARLL